MRNACPQCKSGHCCYKVLEAPVRIEKNSQQQQLDRKNERRKDTIKGQERSASERETAKGKQAGGKQETSTKVTGDHVKHLRAANKGAASPFPLARSTEASRLACVSVLEQTSGDARKGGNTHLDGKQLGLGLAAEHGGCLDMHAGAGCGQSEAHCTAAIITTQPGYGTGGSQNRAPGTISEFDTMRSPQRQVPWLRT